MDRIWLIFLSDLFFHQSCVVMSEIRMECMTPIIPATNIKTIDPSNGEKLDYGFIMDNVPVVRNLATSNNFQHFLLFPDPVYYPFDDENKVKQYKSDYLTINGANLDRASTELDVEVRIGSEFCNVTSLSRSQLTCRPPVEQPLPLPNANNDRNDLPLVVVTIGDRLEYTIGYLEYSGGGDGSTLSKKLIILIVAGPLVLIVILVVCLIVYRRKSNQNSRVLKSMQEQMDVLELRVAAECKEGEECSPYLGLNHSPNCLFNNLVSQVCILKLEKPENFHVRELRCS